MEMKFVAFDLETTGMCPGMDQIVEIGAVLFSQGQPEAVFSTLVDPGRPIPEDASRVNGISDEMVAGKPTIERLLEPFAEFCKELVVVAHNAPFDVHFLEADIKKFESPAPSGVILDTCAMSRKVFPGLPNYKLITLVRHLKIEANEFHRAEQDASACGHLFKIITERVSSDGQPPIENLIALSNNRELRFPQIVRTHKQLSLL